jgi:ubiquinone/menaquinone biosynthesis C-methylase UbiE
VGHHLETEIIVWDKYWEKKKNTPIIHKKQLEKMYRATCNLNNIRTLEIGAGSGIDSLFLAETFGAEVYCVDFSKGALKKIKEKATKQKLRCYLVRADLRNLPFIDCVFDAALSSGVIEHFKDIVSVINQQKRVLKDSGILLMGAPYTFTMYTIRKKILMLINCWPPGWETQISKRTMKRLLKQTNMSCIEVYLDCHPIWYLPKQLRFTIVNIFLNGGIITIAKKELNKECEDTKNEFLKAHRIDRIRLMDAYNLNKFAL